MNIKSTQDALDFKVMCEAKDSVYGVHSVHASWDKINEALEEFSANQITMEKLQDVIRGHMLFLDTEHKSIATCNDKEYNHVIGILKNEVLKDAVDGSLSLKVDIWSEYCELNKIVE